MADQGNPHMRIITKPGVLVFGRELPDIPSITTSFQHEGVIQVSCGDEHSAVVCESGRVYTFGINDAIRSMEITVCPGLVDTLSTVRVTQAACGHDYTLFLSDSGEVYSRGKNGHGQLGLSHTVYVPTPVLVTGLPAIKKVTAGDDYTMVLSEWGEVWGCGSNAYGKLGLEHTTDQTSFTKVPNLPEPIIDISCGMYHTALISASRVLLVAGRNKYGTMGLGDFDSRSSFKPVSLPSTSVAAVSCGWYHMVALGVDGTTWAWGSNWCGQLGTGNSYIESSTPTKMVGLEGQTISQVIAGSYCTAVLTREGDVFMCGDVLSGLVGRVTKNLLTPTLIPKSPGLVVQQVAFSTSYSLLLVVPKLDAIPASQLQIVIPKEVDKAECDLTDLERCIMKSLECPVCYKTMCSPIHQCINGHCLCGSCRSDTHITVCPECRGQFIPGRCITLENLSTNVKLPCTDCLERMPVCELDKHGEVCPQRKYVCPVQQHSCGWSGQLDKMLAHTSSAHPDQTWRDLPHLFVHSLSDTFVQTDLLVAHDQVFTLHRRYDQEAKTFQTALRYIGPPENAHDFIFKFTFIKDHINNSYRRNVCAITENVEGMLLSPNRVAIKSKMLDSFLQRGCLVCRVAILKVGRSELADQIEFLLDIIA